MTTIWFYLGPAALALVAYLVGNDFRKKFLLLAQLEEKSIVHARNMKRAQAEIASQKLLIDAMAARIEEISKEFKYELQSVHDKMQSDQTKSPTRPGPAKTGQPRVATWTQFQRELERAKDAQG